MGYNTNITILNDAFDQLEKHPDEFVAGIRETMHTREGQYRFIRVGNHANAAQVMRTDHADATQLIAVGRNMATKVYSAYNLPSHHKEEGQIAILEAWANKLGYNLVKSDVRV